MPLSAAFATTGSCSASGSCVSSGNYPSSYGNYESCTITVNSPGVLSVTSFSTESGFDEIVIDGIEYEGTSGPDGLAVDQSTSIYWSSDGSVQYSGWEICLTDGDDDGSYSSN